MREKKSLIPRFGAFLIQVLLPAHKSDIVLGDFEEYLASQTAEGKAGARAWYFWKQLLLSIPSFMALSLRHQTSFISHSLLIGLRNIRRHQAPYLINVLGLAIGLSAFLAIMLYVEGERSFDRFHSKSDRIFRILDFRKIDGSGEESSSAPTPLGAALLHEHPDQIAHVVRFFNFQAPSMALAGNGSQFEGKRFNESNLYFVDDSFFEMFDFPLLQGDAATALAGPNQVLLTETMARKYFGRSDPLGKILTLEGKHDLIVSGVLKDVPHQSHMQFDGLVSFKTLDNPEVLSTRLKESWIWNPSWTYVLLHPNVRPESLADNLPSFVQKYFPESRRDRVKLHLQPLEDIHLHSNLDYEMRPNGDAALVRTFFAIGIFILVISYINFINLSVARAISRQKEIGLRKVLGGNERQVFWHLVYESILINTLGLLLSVPLLFGVVTLINELNGIQIAIDLHGLPWPTWQIILGLLTIGLIASFYPALLLSGFRPSKIFRDHVLEEKRFVRQSRRFLVMGQFIISLTLMSATIVAVEQLDYLRNRTVGFQADEVLLIPSLRSPMIDNYHQFKTQLLAQPGIKAVSTAEDIPGMKHQTGAYRVHSENERLQFPRLMVHDDFVKTLGIPLAAGRDYEASFQQDPEESIIINSSLAKVLGYEAAEAIGERFNGETIIGVTEDYHFTSMRKSIGPFVMERVGNQLASLAFSARYIAVRIDPRNKEQITRFIEETWQSLAPGAPFEYRPLGEVLQTQYEAENTLGSLATLFTVLSIIIACLGLYGLSSFMTSRRIKEIGVRRVLGAKFSALIFLLTSSYLKMILVSIVLSTPVAYWLLLRWLEGFAYHVELGPLPFLLASLITIGVVLLTVSYHATRTSLINPVETLRNE